MPANPSCPLADVFIQHFEKGQLSLGQKDLPKAFFFFSLEPILKKHSLVLFGECGWSGKMASNTAQHTSNMDFFVSN